MLTINSKALKIGNKWLTPINGSGPTPPSTTYYVTTSGSHGSVVASPTEGTTGTEVMLSNTPDTGYEFNSYTLTGATLKSSNKFDIANSDVSVVGNFDGIVRTVNIAIAPSGGGTCTATPSSGIIGTTVNLSHTAAEHHTFTYYMLDGSILNTDSFVIGDHDPQVICVISEDPKYSVFVNQSTGGTIAASPVEGYSGTTVTLSNTPATHYTFGSYNLTGATLKNSNQFDIGSTNVTVGATWVEDPKYTVTCTNDGHGTISASPTSGYSGSTVTLSNTPNSGYTLDHYEITSGSGASITNNTLTIGSSNVTVRGVFKSAVTYDLYRLELGFKSGSNNYISLCGMVPTPAGGTVYNGSSYYAMNTTDLNKIAATSGSLYYKSYSSGYVSVNFNSLPSGEISWYDHLSTMSNSCPPGGFAYARLYGTTLPSYQETLLASLGSSTNATGVQHVIRI